MSDKYGTTVEEIMKSSTKKSFFEKITSLLKKKKLTLEKALKKPLEVRSLDLSNQNLTELPDSIGSLKNLSFLSLKKNQLTSLPSSIGDLPKLDILWLGNNALKNIPESIGKLKQLTQLDISENKIQKLPDSICDLNKLKSLDLTNNKLVALPDSFGNLVQLTVLNLGENHLEKLPESFGNIEELTYFNAVGNKLKTLPNSISKTVFHDVYLNKNKLTSLGGLANHSYRIDQLDLDGNQLKEIPKSILDRTSLYLSIRDNLFSAEEKERILSIKSSAIKL